MNIFSRRFIILVFDLGKRTVWSLNVISRIQSSIQILVNHDTAVVNSSNLKDFVNKNQNNDETEQHRRTQRKFIYISRCIFDEHSIPETKEGLIKHSVQAALFVANSLNLSRCSVRYCFHNCHHCLFGCLLCLYRFFIVDQPIDVLDFLIERF